MGSHIPNARSRRLTAELRVLREKAGLNWEKVARQMGWSTSKVYRIEADKVGVILRDVRRLLTLYKVTGAEREALLELAKQARAGGWWHKYADAIPEWFQFYVGLEAEAVTLRAYESELVPGLLQTPEYARAILTMSPIARGREGDGRDGDVLTRQVEIRRRRQERLVLATTGENPLTAWFVLNEAVIRRPVGGAEVMRGQLGRLREVAAQENVTVQVLPCSAGAHPAMQGPYDLLGFGGAEYSDVVYLESLTGSTYLEKAEDVERYGMMFDQLCAQALDPKESDALIAQAAEELR
jgi:transcriptional regulator with XRE-family HTH domain